MSITEEVTFDKEGNVERFPWFKPLFLALVIILVASLSFGIGRLSVTGKREPVRIEYDPSLSTKSEVSNPKQTSNIQTSQTANVINATGDTGDIAQPISTNTVVASKNSDKYHYEHCPGAKQIKEANKITFNSPSEAESAGYTLAANCSPR